MELGKKIIKIRKENNLTQEAFAEKYNVSRQTISSWENSKSYPDIDILVKISDDFSISLDTLLKEDRKIIENISKVQNENKWYKKMFKTMIIVFCIIILLLLIYISIYNTSKYIFESQFNKALKENNFYKNNEFSYSLIYDANITYNVPSEIEVNKMIFKKDSRILTCTIKFDTENILYIVWDDYNRYGVVAYNSESMKEIFNIDLYEEKIDKLQFMKDNTTIDEKLLKNVINKGNDLYEQFYN